MMGNVWEWMESPYFPAYGTGAARVLRGGAYDYTGPNLASSKRPLDIPYYEYDNYGFRVASEVPEPTSMALLSLGGLALLKGRRR